jgi:hypothetical protein
MFKKSKKHKKSAPEAKSHRHTKHFHQTDRQKKASKYHRRSSSDTIGSVRSSRSLSFREKGISESSNDVDSFLPNGIKIKYHSKEKKKKKRNSFVSNETDTLKTSKFRQWTKRVCILVGIVTVAVLGYIAVSWVLEKIALNGKLSLSGEASNDGELDKKEIFFAIDEITNFPSVSSYPTTKMPSALPTQTRSSTPSHRPTSKPSLFPSNMPSNLPSVAPTLKPSVSWLPSESQTPSNKPTEIPSVSSSPTVIEWHQVGNDIQSDGVVFSSDISGNGTRLIIGVPNYANNLGKVGIYELNEGDWNIIKTFVAQPMNFDYQGGSSLFMKYFGFGVRMTSDGSVVAVHTNTEEGYKQIAAFEEVSLGVWRAGATGTGALSFDLSDDKHIDFGHYSLGVIFRRTVCERNNAFRICIHNIGGRDDTLDMIDDQNAIWSMSTSDSGSRIVVGRASYTRMDMALPIAMSGRVDVYDLTSIIHPDTGAPDLFATRVEKDGDQSKVGFLGSGLLERKGAVAKLSGDGSTILVGGYIQMQYSNPEITSVPVNVALGTPYVEVWSYSISEGWMKRGKRLNAPSHNSAWGQACAISTNGYLIAVGDEVYNNIGFVKVFQYDGENWSQLGQTIYGTTYERWGKTLAFSNSALFPRLIITSITKDNNSTVRVLEYGAVK